VSPRLALPVGTRDHVQGSLYAPVTLLEYGDYQCPYCAQAYVSIKAVQRELGRSLRFAFRNFPLTTIHPEAEGAAEMAEIAAEHGKFWEMHDMLYEHHDALGAEDLLAYAEALGLEPREVYEALNQHTTEPRVREDFMSGVRSGVNGTPTFFINEFRYDGPWDPRTLSEVLRDAERSENRVSARR
jgi:protein-disulfide isomerase